MPISKVPGCVKDKDGLLLYDVRVNYTDSYGKKKRKHRRIRGWSEAKNLEQKLLFDVKTNTLDDTSKITLQQLWEEYSTEKAQSTRRITQYQKQSMWKNRIMPYIDVNIPINKITAKTIQQWKSNFGILSLKTSTKKQTYIFLSAIFNYAVKMEYISKNPMRFIDNFKDVETIKKEINYYEPEEFKKFIIAAKQYAETEEKKGCLAEWDYFVFFLIAFYTGLRKGEIQALEWTDIKNNILSVKRNVSQVSNDNVTPVKNKSSIRDIQIPNILLDELNKHKQRKKSLQDKTGCQKICAGANTRFLRNASIKCKLEKYAKLAGIKKIRVHDFRHSHASLLANMDINIQEIARRLGHSDVRMTWNTYSHIYPKEEEKAISVLDNVIKF